MIAPDELVQLVSTTPAEKLPEFVKTHNLTIDSMQAFKSYAEQFHFSEPARAVEIAEAAYQLGVYLPEPAAGLGQWTFANALLHDARYREAAIQYENARLAYLTLGNALDAARLSVGYVGVLAYIGRHQDALNLAQEIEPILTESGKSDKADLRRLRILMSNVGMVHELLGEYEKAIALYERQIQMVTDLQDQHLLGQLQNNRALALVQIGAFQEALTAYAQAETLFQANYADADLLRMYINLGNLLVLLSRYDEAMAIYERARQLSAAEGEAWFRLAILLAQVLIKSKRAIEPQVLAFLAQAQQGFATHGSLLEEGLACILLGRCHLVRAEHSMAQGCFEHALYLAERGADRLLKYRAAHGFAQLERQSHNYAAAIAHYENAILELEAIRHELQVDLFRAGFLTDKVEVYHDLADLYIELGAFETLFQVVERSKSRILSEKLAAPLDEMVQHSDVAAAGKDRWQSALPNVQTLLHDALFLQYHLVDEWVYLFLIDSSGIQQHLRLCKQADVEQSYRQFSAATERMLEISAQFGTERAVRYLPMLLADVNNHLQQLSNLLIEPVTSQLTPQQMLIIAPDGLLSYIPFHALFDGTQYLIEKHAIHYTPSATVLDLCTRRTANPHGNLFVGYDDVKLQSVVDEIETIAPLFPAATVGIGDQATAQLFLEHATSARLLHLAAHASFRTDDPLQSALVLADRRLTLAEIITLRLNAELVVLSGCETGFGQLRGVDLLSLASSFWGAGARNVVMSLWRVADHATALLMQHFYRHLLQRDSYAQAMRAAQLALLTQGRQATGHERVLAHPVYWAAFVVMGATAQSA